MAYDRYETRRDRWRNERDENDRGFFEKAGDEVASWFGDDEAERRRREDEMMNRERGRERNDRDNDRYAIGGWGERSSNRDFDRTGGQRGHEPSSWRSSEREDRQPRGGYDRDNGARGGLGSGYDRDYGSSYGSQGSESRGYDRSESDWGRDDYRNTSFAGSMRDNDRDYGAWRQRQLNDLDRDYDQYCRERQDRFENDFGTWRNERVTKRQQLGRIQEHMDVVGSDGETVGKVDKVRGDRIILTKSDSDDNRHHMFDCSLIETVEGDQVRLQVPAEEAKSRFDQDRGFFGRDENEDTSLERSFSGTYTR